MALRWQKNPRGEDGWFAWDDHGFSNLRTRTVFRAHRITREFWAIEDCDLHETHAARTFKECKQIAFNLLNARMSQ